jgi:threonylcarbamoyladenosine tRNA methylthiotransferase MtaB
MARQTLAMYPGFLLLPVAYTYCLPMKIAITTLGCKISLTIPRIQSRLEEKHSFVPFDESADCYIINTCTVTDRADWEARQLVRRAKRLNPDSKVLLTGCYAQVSAQDVAAVPGVDYVVGLNRLGDLLCFVDAPATSQVEIAVSDVKRERSVAVLARARCRAIRGRFSKSRKAATTLALIVLFHCAV